MLLAVLGEGGVILPTPNSNGSLTSQSQHRLPPPFPSLLPADLTLYSPSQLVLTSAKGREVEVGQCKNTIRQWHQRTPAEPPATHRRAPESCREHIPPREAWIKASGRNPLASPASPVEMISTAEPKKYICTFGLGIGRWSQEVRSSILPSPCLERTSQSGWPGASCMVVPGCPQKGWGNHLRVPYLENPDKHCHKSELP